MKGGKCDGLTNKMAIYEKLLIKELQIKLIKKIMKKILYIVMIVLLGGMNNTVSAGGDGETKNSIAKSLARIRIDFSTRAMQSAGACEGNRGICLIIGIERNEGDSPRGFNGSGEIYLNSENKLVLNITRDEAPEAEDKNTFYIYEDIILNDEISELLGVSRCIIKKGIYKINYSEYEFGTVILNTNLK